MNTATIVQKLWNYCNVLRDDGMSYGDYVEQLTYLLFLKMADERAKAPYNQKSPVPSTYSWPSLIKKDGDELFDQFSGSHYPALARKPSPRLLPRAFGRTEVHWTSVRSRLTRHTLEALGNQKGLLGLIFNKSQNKFDSPHPWASAFGRAARAQIDSGHPWPSPSGRASLVQFRFKRNCHSRRICQDPAKLRRLVVDLIDKEQCVSMSADVKGYACIVNGVF